MLDEKRFNDMWREQVEGKDTRLCAGIDFDLAPKIIDGKIVPSPLMAGIGKPPGIFLTEYMSAVAPYVAAFKPNTEFFDFIYRFDEACQGMDQVHFQEKVIHGQRLLEIVVEHAKELGIPIIRDRKSADIGSTNERSLTNAKLQGYNATTVAPKADNLVATAEMAEKLGIDIFTMCLMSDSAYERHKDDLVVVSNMDEYDPNDIIHLENGPRIPRYIVDINEAAKNPFVAGVVVGATGHVQPSETRNIVKYMERNARDDMTILLPGMGAQGGQLGEAQRNLPLEWRVIVNQGRGLMHPNGELIGNPELWAANAGAKRDEVNSLIR